ncbi:MAG: hypothetical protein ABI614_10805 [Planctomycetota bacterium]
MAQLIECINVWHSMIRRLPEHKSGPAQLLDGMKQLQIFPHQGIKGKIHGINYSSSDPTTCTRIDGFLVRHVTSVTTVGVGRQGEREQEFWH